MLCSLQHCSYVLVNERVSPSTQVTACSRWLARHLCRAQRVPDQHVGGIDVSTLELGAQLRDDRRGVSRANRRIAAYVPGAIVRERASASGGDARLHILPDFHGVTEARFEDDRPGSVPLESNHVVRVDIGGGHGVRAHQTEQQRLHSGEQLHEQTLRAKAPQVERRNIEAGLAPGDQVADELRGGGREREAEVLVSHRVEQIGRSLETADAGQIIR